jgi:hypothetical protein
MSFSRYADWGDHRHPVHFSGDVVIGWPMLQFEVPFTSTAGNVGAFFWSHDIGGFMDDMGGIQAKRDKELYARWLQFGALSPVLRLHSTESAFLDKRPWKWGSTVERVGRSMFHLRSELMPYLYASAWQSHRDSVPMDRPMYFDHAADEKAYWQPQEFQLGDSLVAAPVTQPGTGPGKVGSQIVWLPEGQPWYQWFTGEKFDGGFYGLVSSDIDELPLFAKGGAPILLANYSERPATEPLPKLKIRAYPGVNGVSTKAVLYEDDGISQDYLNGSNATTDVIYTQAAGRAIVDIYPTAGTYAGQLPERSYSIELPLTQNAIGARINGVAADWAYDAVAHTNVVVVPARDIRSGARIEVMTSEISTAEMATIKKAAEERRVKGIGMNGDALLALQGTGLPDEGKNVVEAFLGEGVTAAHLEVHDEIGASGSSKIVLNQNCSPRAICRFALAAPRAPDSAPTGSKLVRRAILTAVIAGETHRFERVMDEAPTYLRTWSVTGPFAYDPTQDISRQRYRPELTDLPGQQGAWKQVPLLADESVDLTAAYGYKTAIAYGLTCISTENDQAMKLKVNSDDGIEVYLDGRRLESKNVFRDLTADPDEILTLLTAGEHQLLFKVANRAGGWGFRSQIETGVPVNAHICVAR